MQRSLTLAVLTLAAVLAVATSAQCQQKKGQFEELVRRVPSTANALVLLDVDKSVASDYGKKMQWADKIERAFESGVTVVSPGATQTVVAAQLDMASMEPLWEMAVMRLKHEPDVESAAKLYMGNLDRVGDYDAIELPSGAYAIKFGPHIAAAMTPANRQSVSRWLRETDGRKTPELSPYLAEAYRFANDLGTPMIFAIDLEDVPSVDQVRTALSLQEDLKVADVNIDDLANAVAGIRGVTLGVTLKNVPFGKLKIDFREKISLEPELAKMLVLAALEKRGAMLVELEDWKPEVNGKQITLEGDLTSSGIRRLTSFFEKPPAMPSSEQLAEATQAPQQDDPAEKTKYASKRFFKSINDLLADLQEKPKRSKRHTWGQIGVWCKNYARKIDQLSTLDVDPELVEFAEVVSNALRGTHSELASGAAEARIGELNVAPTYNTYNYGTTYGYSMWGGAVGSYGSYSVQNVRAYKHDRTRARTSARLGAATDARIIMANLEIAVTDMRHKMTQKYQIEF